MGQKLYAPDLLMRGHKNRRTVHQIVASLQGQVTTTKWILE